MKVKIAFIKTREINNRKEEYISSKDIITLDLQEAHNFKEQDILVIDNVFYIITNISYFIDTKSESNNEFNIYFVKPIADEQLSYVNLCPITIDEDEINKGEIIMEDFLRELTELSKKYSIGIGGYECCGSPFLYDIKTGKIIATDLDLVNDLDSYEVNIG